jgi:hypothetical protein
VKFVKVGRTYSGLKIRQEVSLGVYAVLEQEWSGAELEVSLRMCIVDSYIVPDLSDDHTVYTVVHIEPHVLKAKTVCNPKDNLTFRKAINGHHADNWWRAMEVEHHTLEYDVKAWKLVKCILWMKVLPGTWAFRLKRFPVGAVKKFKARFYVKQRQAS